MNTIVYPPSQMEFEWDEAKNMVKNDDRLGRIEKCYRRDGMYTTRRKHSCHLRSNQSLSNLASLLISFRNTLGQQASNGSRKDFIWVKRNSRTILQGTALLLLSTHLARDQQIVIHLNSS